ncbi:hypothetical protein PA7_31520 [Pseudonocardia asaccharolytica DSM 44247 = NBRC 16224]|uniref:Uncharacterized protein n=1 Tax=Pseudonocardia asaccharolytica DSM 44247 = NBRC 16224 TaxID=1123024 RepID=A0A511D3G8_9PSEU|nr:hypothetical protein PA7_31520 [Pseudonocardia asaccharolytica DSM 44247 = NBRC 16224]
MRGDDAGHAQIAGDDALLTVLGRGGPTPVGDVLAAMLAAWRAHLVADPPLDVTRLDAALARIGHNTVQKRAERFQGATPRGTDCSPAHGDDSRVEPTTVGGSTH